MLFYRVFGSPEKQLLVFLHGFLGSHLDFLPLIEDLKKDFFCVALDLPAHGKSPYESSALKKVEETIAFFRQKPILIGYSMGGRIALQLRDSLGALDIIVLSSHLGLSSLEDKQKKWEEDLLWERRLLSLSPQDFLNLWYSQPIFSSLAKNAILLEKTLKNRLYKNPKELSLLLKEMSLAKQPGPSIDSSSTYFLFGENDAKYKTLYSNLPRSYRVDSVEKAGHALLLENPKKCSELIRAYLLK